eukprot:513329_1
MSKKGKSKKNKSKSEPKISMPNNKIRSLCMTTDIVFDIRAHPANKNNMKIIKAFARQYSNKIDSMQDIFGVISYYFIYLDGNSVSGEWKYYKKDDSDDRTCNYIMKIKDNLSFNILLRFYFYKYSPGGSSQSLILNGNILIINDTTFLLFFDQESAKMFRNTKDFFRCNILNGYVWEEPFFNMSYRDSIYLNRVLKIYKKHKVNIKKKYRSQIETVRTLQKEFKKNKNIINTVRWEHILLKDKQMRLAKIITANKAKKEFIKRRLAKNFESKYRATEHHKLYAKICAKYNEIVLPVYLGPLMLHFEDCNRTKCMLYYGKEPVFLQWLSNSSTSHEKI